MATAPAVGRPRLFPPARESAIGDEVSSPAGSSLDWHRAPVRQYVITLSGTLEFETRLGQKFTLAPGTILLAEDTHGGGHKWRVTDDEPWRRVYVGLE